MQQRTFWNLTVPSFRREILLIFVFNWLAVNEGKSVKIVVKKVLHRFKVVYNVNMIL